MPALMDRYLEQPGESSRSFSHLAIYATDDGFAVEEVVGEIDSAGRRSGTIIVLASALSRSDAEAQYRAAVETRKDQGYRPAPR